MKRCALMLIMAACAGPALAQAVEGFKSPSGNIACSFLGPAPGIPANLRCDIMRTSNRPPLRPRDCELEFGNAFELTPTSRGRYLCYGDTIAQESFAILPYGEVWRRDGFTCFSAESGVTCRNNAGGGFELSRARQRVF